MQPAPARGLTAVRTRFLGRDTSLKEMLQLTRNLQQNIGAIVWIEGEAGIGKSRLMREFRDTLPDFAGLIWSGDCSPQRKDNAFSLFADLLGPVFNIRQSDSMEKKRQEIDAVLATWPEDTAATRPYLEVLNGIHPEGLAGERLNRLQPEQLRQQISSPCAAC